MNTEYSNEELVVLARQIISGKLTPTIMHKLKNILMPLTGYVELLEGTPPQNKGIYLKKIEDAGGIMQRLLKRFLRFSRPSREKEEIKIPELIEDIISLFEHYMVVARVTLKKDIASDLRVNAVYGDLSLIIASILMNAIEATPPSGEIRISAGSEDRKISILIENDGPAIREHVKDKIFAPFFTEKKGSLGIGLTVSLFLARNLSGDIVFKPGNRFIISL
jgi:signal transduction histidine kinase